MFDALGLQLRASLQFSSLKSFLGADLVKLSLAVLGALLQLAQTLNLFFLLFLDAGILAKFGLLTLLLQAVELSDLGVKLLLSLTGSFFLGKSVFVCNLDFFIHDANTFALGCLRCFFFLPHLFDVGKHDLL